MIKLVRRGAEVRPVAYLAPEIPALSATFVYEEIHALERRGIHVTPFSVHFQSSIASEQQELLARTEVLYSRHALSGGITGLLHVARNFSGLPLALSWLVSDIIACGSLRAAVKLAFQFIAGARLASGLKKNKCCHLHIHFAHVPTQIGMYAAAFSGLPFTVTAHANDIFQRGFLLVSKSKRALYIFCISDFNRQYLLSNGLPDEKLVVVRCGVSFPSVARIPKPHCGTVRIGSLGRLVEKKGFDILLRTFAKLAAIYPRIELSIAGDGPLRQELEQLAQQLGLGVNVAFIGSLSHYQVANWMQSLDMFVLACKKDAHGDMDGIPVVLMEAMSQHIPVISTRLSGIPELVIHQSTGLLAEPGDVASLAEQIQRNLMDPAQARSMAEQGARHVVQEFGQDVNIDRIIRFASLEPDQEWKKGNSDP
jgi:glycosyltransferase involved in cell wall biosynthesis